MRFLALLLVLVKTSKTDQKLAKRCRLILLFAGCPGQIQASLDLVIPDPCSISGKIGLDLGWIDSALAESTQGSGIVLLRAGGSGIGDRMP